MRGKPALPQPGGERGPPRPPRQGPSAPAAASSHSPRRGRAGAAGASADKGSAAGLGLGAPGTEEEEGTRAPKAAGERPRPSPADGSGRSAPGEDGAAKRGEHVLPPCQEMPPRDKRRKEGEEVTGDSLQTLFPSPALPRVHPGALAPPAALAKRQNHSPSVNTAAVQAAELSAPFPPSVSGLSEGISSLTEILRLVPSARERQFGESLEKLRLCNGEFKAIFNPQGN